MASSSAAGAACAAAGSASAAGSAFAGAAFAGSAVPVVATHHEPNLGLIRHESFGRQPKDFQLHLHAGGSAAWTATASSNATSTDLIVRDTDQRFPGPVTFPGCRETHGAGSRGYRCRLCAAGARREPAGSPGTRGSPLGALACFTACSAGVATPFRAPNCDLDITRTQSQELHLDDGWLDGAHPTNELRHAGSPETR